MIESAPIIVPRQDHPISRRNLSPNALRVLYRLKEHGFIAYLVGGCVRDLWLGREPKDFDVVTDATPNQLKRLFRNCRLIGRRFRLAHLHFTDEIIEVATFRSLASTEEAPLLPEEEGTGRGGPRHLKSDEGMVLRDNVFGTPEEDARRRDFTVNALSYNIVDFSLIDYVGGIDDLQRGVIRTIGDPGVRFTEDPVRMLRAVRFAALLGFTIEPATWEAMVELGATIDRAAPPRLFEEVLKLFLCGEGERCYQLMRQTGLFSALFPLFTAWLETESDGFPHVRVGKALEWVDDAGQRGERVTPQLLLALLFGQYLEEKAEDLRRAGLPGQQAMDSAVAEFLGELAPTVLVPHKLGILVRDILATQNRLSRTPGKRPQQVVGRKCFSDALAYLRFAASAEGEGDETAAWWERYSLEDASATGAAQAGDAEPALPAAAGTRKRRRRRRRKSGSGDSSGDTTASPSPPPVE
jgi:poly(A) polymerase